MKGQMRPQDNVELAIRAAHIAERVLQLTRPAGKLHAKIVLTETIKAVKELADKIESLPEE